MSHNVTVFDRFFISATLLVMEIKCAHTELVDTQTLVANPRNPNKHSDAQIKLLAKILKYQGWRSPIVVSKRSGFIVKGHGRLAAARLNGWSAVPVDRQDYINEADEWADMIADNEIARLAEADHAMIRELAIEMPEGFDLDLLGIPDLDLGVTVELGCDEDAIPEIVETKSKLGDLYVLGNHRLLCGDSTNIQHVDKLMNGEKADMVFTDPPYGIDEETDRAFASRSRKAKGNTFNKIIGDESIDTALAGFSISDSLSPIVCYWGGNYYAHKLPPSPCWLVWDKRVEENQRDMNSDCELAYVKHPTKESVRIFRHLWKGMIKGSEHDSGRVHPTQKPIALAEWCIDELAKESMTVLDLFGGSGSTLIACEKTQRKCFMMELDPHYCDVIVARWEKYTGRKAILDAGSSDKRDILPA
jgi:DNA modification methylase